MIEQASQGDKMGGAMGIGQDRTHAHVRCRFCTNDRGTKSLVSMAMVKVSGEDVT